MTLGIVKRLFAPLAISFLLYFAWQSRDSLVEIVSSAQALPLLLSIAAWLLMHALAPLFATVVFRGCNSPLKYAEAFDIHVRNLPARYVPGGIWHTVGRIAAFRKHGAEKRDVAVFVFLENILAASLAFMMGGAVVVFFRGLNGWGQPAALAAIGGIALLLLCPLILNTRMLKGGDTFPMSAYINSVILVAASWCVAASAFVTYLSAFPGLQLAAAPLEIAGNYLFAWGVGFVSVFAPQGIGIFEVVSAELIRETGTLGGLAALLAGFRLVILAADSLAYAALQLFSISRRNQSRT